MQAQFNLNNEIFCRWRTLFINTSMLRPFVRLRVHRAADPKHTHVLYMHVFNSTNIDLNKF